MYLTLERVKCSDIWCVPPSDSNDLIIYQIVLPIAGVLHHTPKTVLPHTHTQRRSKKPMSIILRCVIPVVCLNYKEG